MIDANPLPDGIFGASVLAALFLFRAMSYTHAGHHGDTSYYAKHKYPAVYQRRTDESGIDTSGPQLVAAICTTTATRTDGHNDHD